MYTLEIKQVNEEKEKAGRIIKCNLLKDMKMK